MARAVISSNPGRRPAFEPMYDLGETLEGFFIDLVLVRSVGARGLGWFWWSCKPGSLPDHEPQGPFPSSYRAYPAAVGGTDRLFGK
jgi:hypothetical protein